MPAKYEMISAELQEQIKSGKLKPGDRLPTTKTLMDTYGVSETVVRYVMVDLRARGLIRGSQGKAVFVAERA